MSRDRSTALPFVIEIFWSPYPCGAADWGTLPDSYSTTHYLAESGLGDANPSILVGGSGSGSSNNLIVDSGSCVLAIRDTAHAIFMTPTAADPRNLNTLLALGDQIAYDYWSWKLTAFDDVYNGVIAPDLDGLTDRIIWTYDADNCHTRRISAPWDSDTEYLNHQDLTSCDARLKVYSDKCVILRIWTEDGILKWTKLAKDQPG